MIQIDLQAHLLSSLLLFLCGQAVEFLSRVEMLASHAVHFAIALQDMELLNLTDSVQSKLCESVVWSQYLAV